MKNLFTLSAIVVALFLTNLVYSMEMTADVIKPLQEYSGKARIVFKPCEKFEITSNRILALNGLTVFSGNVVVKFQESTIKTDTMTVEKKSGWINAFGNQKILT